jgi:hypothetical protein
MDAWSRQFHREMVDWQTVAEEHLNAARSLATKCCEKICHLPGIIDGLRHGSPGTWPTLEEFDQLENWVAATLHRPAVLRAIELGNARVDTSVQCFDRIVPTMHHAAVGSIQELVFALEANLGRWGEPRELVQCDDDRNETIRYRKYPPSKLAKTWTTLCPRIEEGCPWLSDWESRLSVEWRNALDWLAKRDSVQAQSVNSPTDDGDWSEWKPRRYWEKRLHISFSGIKWRARQGQLTFQRMEGRRLWRIRTSDLREYPEIQE